MQEPEGDGWPAYYSQMGPFHELWKQSGNATASSDRHDVDVSFWERTGLFSLLTFLPYLVLLATLTEALHWTAIALWQGHWQLLLATVLAHLPLLAKWKREQRSMKRVLQKYRDDKADQWADSQAQETPYELRQQIPMIRIQPGGIAITRSRIRTWSQFTGFIDMGNEGRYYRMRLIAVPPPLAPNQPAFLDQVLTYLPTGLCFGLLAYGLERFGWRADVHAVAAIAALHLLFLLIGLTAWTSNMAKQAQEIAQDQLADLILDSAIVPREDCLAFLSSRLQQREDPKHG